MNAYGYGHSCFLWFHQNLVDDVPSPVSSYHFVVLSDSTHVRKVRHLCHVLRTLGGADQQREQWAAFTE